MDDKSRGLYRKFKSISRADGSSEPGRKHEGCRYFVLDLDHDPFAKPALMAYGKACRPEYSKLADDLERVIAGDLDLLGSDTEGVY